ncbi:hypothetical protein RYH80_19795 [Halobaculum sp. MBLA0147]|uniref:hypothetical protein n=1 Tax=Halobaculum sp. MBLA0147 TaxID=3079934 RepID=UPI003524AA39
MEPIRRREDTHNCGCVRCRSVDAQLIRQSVGGDLLVGAVLTKRHPSVVVAALGLLIVTGLLDPLWTRIGQPVPVVDVPAKAIFFFGVLSVGIRAYAVTLFTASVSDQTVSTRESIQYCVSRLPALCATLVGIIAASFAAIGVASVGATVLFALALGVRALTGLTLVDDSVFTGASATLMFGSVMALAAFKFWLAPEICVGGGYGPVAALRLSWSLTPTHRLRLLIVVVGFAATVFGGDLLANALATIGSKNVLVVPSVIGAIMQVLLYIVWFAVGTQIYLRSVVDH